MNHSTNIRIMQLSAFIKAKWLLIYQKTRALRNYTGTSLLIVCSAFMGLSLQYRLRKIDPYSAVVDSSIWVIICYTLCSFLIYHGVSLKLTQLLLRQSKYNHNQLKTDEKWYGQVYFIGTYFLLLYGFLLCLLLWL